MFNGYFTQALREEFYRVFNWHDRNAPIITAIESGDYADFGRMYLMGALRAHPTTNHKEI